MEYQVAQLEDRLAKAVLEEELLKSEGTMLERELNRLIKLDKHRQEVSLVEEKMHKVQAKYEKVLGLADDKIRNCLETIRKYESLLSKLGDDSPQKSGDLDGSVTSYRLRQNSGTETRVYKQIKCEECLRVLKPAEYFEHLEDGVCSGYDHANK